MEGENKQTKTEQIYYSSHTFFSFSTTKEWSVFSKQPERQRQVRFVNKQNPVPMAVSKATQHKMMKSLSVVIL